MEADDFTIAGRDAALGRLHQIDADQIQDAVFAPRASAGGPWSVTVPAVVDGQEYAPAAALQQPGAGIIVTAPDGVLCSGSVEEAVCVQTADDPDGVWTFTGTTDTELINDAVAYRNPASTDPAAQMLVSDVRTGKAETLLHAFVSANIGPNAPTARRSGLLWEKLVMAPDLGRGPTRTGEGTFQPLLELCQQLVSNSTLVFGIVQDGAALRFSVRESADLRDSLRLDIDNDQLQQLTRGTSSPTLTQAIVAMDGTQRTVVVATDSDTARTWGRRRERFIQGSGTSAADLQVQALNAIADAKAPASFEVVPSEDVGDLVPLSTLLGSTVTVVVGSEQEVARVNQVTVGITGEGVTTAVTLGDPDGTDWEGMVGRALDSLSSRVSAIERQPSGLSFAVTNWNLATEPGMYVAVNGALNAPVSGELHGVVTRSDTTIVQTLTAPATAVEQALGSLRRVGTVGAGGAVSWGSWQTPGRIAQGATAITAPAGGVGSVTIVYPAGRFTAPPHAYPSLQVNNPRNFALSVEGRSATGCTIYMSNAGTAASTLGIMWLAVQANAGGANG